MVRLAKRHMDDDDAPIWEQWFSSQTMGHPLDPDILLPPEVANFTKTRVLFILIHPNMATGGSSTLPLLGFGSDKAHKGDELLVLYTSPATPTY
jgi:hypothetical protein